MLKQSIKKARNLQISTRRLHRIRYVMLIERRHFKMNEFEPSLTMFSV